MDSLQRFYKGLTELIKKFSLTQLLLIATIFVISLVGIMFAAGVFKSVTYGVLYSDLDPQESGEIAAELKEMGVSYELTDGGKTIKIPSGDVYQTRITLASQGMPTGGSAGYSIFDKTNLGMTDFIQKVNYRRALEGELARTISNLEEIRAARVHIVIPEKRLFQEDQKEPTASVVLKLSGAGSLTKRQMYGIKHLVASSVEGLMAENITIVDNWGNLLTSPQGSDPMVALSATQLELKKTVESYLENKAHSLLASALGNSRAVVKIDAELDFDQVSKTMESFDPDQVAIRSEERLETAMADSSIGTDTSLAGGSEITERVITNYEVSKSVQSVASSVGNIKRLSIAILVDGSYEEVEDPEGVIEKEYIPRDSTELAQLSAIVKRAVGFDDTRDDEISIVNIPFDTSDLEQQQMEMQKMDQMNFYIEVGKKVLIFLGILIAFLYVRSKLKKAFRAIARYAPKPPPAPKVDMKKQEEEKKKKEEEEEIKLEKPKPKLIDKMKVMAEQQPDELAKVIKTMMMSE